MEDMEVKMDGIKLTHLHFDHDFVLIYQLCINRQSECWHILIVNMGKLDSAAFYGGIL